MHQLSIGKLRMSDIGRLCCIMQLICRKIRGPIKVCEDPRMRIREIMPSCGGNRLAINPWSELIVSVFNHLSIKFNMNIELSDKLNSSNLLNIKLTLIFLRSVKFRIF